MSEYALNCFQYNDGVVDYASWLRNIIDAHPSASGSDMLRWYKLLLPKILPRFNGKLCTLRGWHVNVKFPTERDMAEFLLTWG